MGEFEIACKNVTGWAGQINGCSKELRKQEGRVLDVARRMRSYEMDYRGIGQALSGIAASLHGLQGQMARYGDMLENIARAYESTEAGILAEGAQERSA